MDIISIIIHAASHRQPLPQHPHQGKSRVKARSLAALSAFEDVFELDDRDRELRSFVVVPSLEESPSSKPDSVTDSNLALFLLFLLLLPEEEFLAFRFPLFRALSLS